MQTPLALQKNISIASLMKSIRLFVVLSQTKKCIITIYCKPDFKKKPFMFTTVEETSNELKVYAKINLM